LAALFLSGTVAHADQCADLVAQWDRLIEPSPQPALPDRHAMLGSCQANAAQCAYARAQRDYARRSVETVGRRLAMVDPMFNACEARGSVLLHTWGAGHASPGASRVTRTEARANVRRDLADAQRDADFWQTQVDHDCDQKQLTTVCFDAEGGL
jgi:hypothetical protein